MKVLYLHQYFNTPDVPGGTRSFEMARRLIEAGHEVNMVTSRWQTGESNARSWTETEAEGIRIHSLSIPYSNSMAYRDRLAAFFRFAFLARSKAAGIDCDVVFATSTPLTISIPAVHAARKNRCPLVFEVRDLWPALPIAVGALKSPLSMAAARRLERFAYNNSARIVALSPGIKDGIAATGYPEDRIAVIPNGCDISLFDIGPEEGRRLRQRFDWLLDRPLVIYTGTMGMINGVDYLARLAAAARQIDPDVRFLVLGDGKEEAKVRRAAADLGVLDRNFFMMGSVPKCEIPKWLSAADIAMSLFVDIKIMWTNSANKFFDALAAGKPIAINYGGWQADILTRADAGLVLDAQDVDSSARALVGAVRNKKWLAKAGQAAGQVARESFGRDHLAPLLENVLRKAVGENN